MANHKNILVPVDGSEQSYKAVDEAVRIAHLNQAKLYVLTVKDENRYYGIFNKEVREVPGIDQLSEDILQISSDIIREQVEFETYAIKGKPKQSIVSFIEDMQYEIDLIVIGATGTDKFDRLLIGSTTSYVMNNTSCSILVVRN